MRHITKLLLLFAILVFPVFAQSQTNPPEQKLLNVQIVTPRTIDSYGLYIFWLNEKVEFIPLPVGVKPGDYENRQILVLTELNKLYEKGWKLKIFSWEGSTINYFFEKD